MTVPPPSGPGPQGVWNQPPAGGAWPPPAGVGGYPEPGYGPGPGGYPEPAYGPGPGGYPPPGGYPGPGYPPPQKPGTNGFAIAALIFGIIGGVLLGFIFGFIALSQTKRTGQNGRGMAIAGIVLSAMWTIGIILAIILAAATAAKRDDGGTVRQGGDISATALQVGDCVNDLKNSTNVLSLPGVPCTQPHEGEVFAVFDLPAGDYPGTAAVDEQVTKECTDRIEAYSPSAARDPGVGLFSVYPLEQNWNRGDRQVVCIATAATGTTTGSIKGR
jgi:hypothetical protein